MTKTKLICFVGLAVFTVGLLFLAQSGTRDVDLNGTTFPTLTSGTRVELPPKDGEEIRYVYFAPDQVTRRMLQIEYRSGVTAFTSYRADGGIRETRSFFPLKDGASKRQLRSLITFQDDGRTYKSHQVYREDGTLERSGGRLAAGAYQTLYFNAKDGSVQRRLVFSNSSQLDEEESYSDTGTLIEKTEKSGIGELKTTRWSASGILLSEIFDQGDGRRHGKLYYEDGKTVKIEFEHRGYEITANYFDKKGVIEFAVEYVLQGMGVTVYGPGEKALYKQYWLLLSGTTLSDAKYRLVKVEEFDRWGDDRDSHELKRVIGIADDGKTPKIILTPVNTYSYERTETELYPDGSVKSEKVYDSSNQVVSDKSFNQGEQKVDIKPELFIKPVFEPLDPPESKYKTASPSEEGEPTED